MNLNKFAKKMYRELRMCSRKTPYYDERMARRTGQRVYQCFYCGFWHRTGELVRLRNPVLPPDFVFKPHHVTKLRIKLSKLHTRR